MTVAEFLDSCSMWNPCLFNHTYMTITVYDTESGLDAQRDLGDVYSCWLEYDDYIEMDTEMLLDLSKNYVIDTVSYGKLTK